MIFQCRSVNLPLEELAVQGPLNKMGCRRQPPNFLLTFSQLGEAPWIKPSRPTHLRRLVHRYRDEFELTCATAIGVLEIAKLELWEDIKKSQENDDP